MNKTCWTKNRYPDEWSSKIVNHTLQKIIGGGKDQLRTAPKEHQKSKTRSHDKQTTFLQYRGNLTQYFASKITSKEETMRIANDFYNADLKMMPSQPEINF